MLLLVSALAVPFLLLGVLAAGIVAITKFAGQAGRRRSGLRAPAPAAGPAPVVATHSYAASRTAGGPAARDDPGVATPSPRDELLPLGVWRYDQLVHLGVEPLTAAAAALTGVDASAVRSLVESGCPPLVALRILEPD